MGVIGIIYESRPNVTPDAFSLTFKAGSACILKGGSDCIESNKAIVKVLRKVLEDEGLNPDILQLIESTDRAVTTEFMKMKDLSVRLMEDIMAIERAGGDKLTEKNRAKVWEYHGDAMD